MALVFVDEDPWLQELSNCEHLCSELALRVDTLRAKSEDAGKVSDIRLCLRQCDQQLIQLRSSLFSEEMSSNITSEEQERRERCLESLMDKLRHLRAQYTSLLSNKKLPSDPNRQVLFADDTIPSERIVNIPEYGPEQMGQVIAEQDRGLDELAKIISRQKNLARTIDSEVTTQNQIITDLTDSVGRVGSRTEAATARTSNLILRDDTCGYWTVIILLLISIVVVAIV